MVPCSGIDTAGHRTVFLNPLPVDGLVNFSINYLYAAIRLNAPVFFAPSFKDLFLTIYAWALIYALYRYRKPATLTGFCARALVISHLLVLLVFEPDHGTYLRHLSSVSLMMACMINFHRQGNDPLDLRPTVTG